MERGFLATLLTFLCRDDEGEGRHQSARQGIDAISIAFAFVSLLSHPFCFLWIVKHFIHSLLPFFV